MRRATIGINLGADGSTGTMMLSALQYAKREARIDYYVFIPWDDGSPNTIPFLKKIGFWKKVYRHFLVYKNRVPDGSYFRSSAKNVIKSIKKISRRYDDVTIHLHNLHHCYLDTLTLLRFLAKTNFRVFYTLHDCWPLTGGCYHYGTIPCDHWKTGCKTCPARLPQTRQFFKKRDKYLHKIRNLMLFPCSNWLADEARKSSLRDIPMRVVYGETGLLVKPRDVSLKTKLGIPEGNKVIISVSAYWNEWKGQQYIYEIAKRLPNNYTFLIVGGQLDSKGFSNIVAVPTVPSDQLSVYLQLSDCFVSVTQCETLGLVIPEAELCGVPVVGFGHGGTKEAVTPQSGIMLDGENDLDKLLDEMIYVVEKKPFKKEDIVAAGMPFAPGEYAKRMLPIYRETTGMENIYSDKDPK